VKIVTWTDAPWAHTGYGIQNLINLRILQELGHEVVVASTFGLHGAALTWGDTTIYPVCRNDLGEDVLPTYLSREQADVVLSLLDVWGASPKVRRTMPCAWAAQIPVDGTPVSERMRYIISSIDYPAAISRFGQGELEKVGVEAAYVPLSIDTETFTPGNKMEARTRLGLPQDRFIVSVVATNKGYPSRKSWPELLRGFARFLVDCPAAMIYLHTTMTPYGSKGVGFYFEPFVRQLGLSPSSYTFPDEKELAIGLSQETMRDVYVASDVLLSPSMGEGFGLPIVEAQACGCPVITQNCTAMAELTVNGLAIEPLQPFWVPPLTYYWYLASEQRIARALHQVHDRTAYEVETHAWAGINFVRDEFSIPVVRDLYWRPWLREMEATLW